MLELCATPAVCTISFETYSNLMGWMWLFALLRSHGSRDLEKWLRLRANAFNYSDALPLHLTLSSIFGDRLKIGMTGVTLAESEASGRIAAVSNEAEGAEHWVQVPGTAEQHLERRRVPVGRGDD